MVFRVGGRPYFILHERENSIWIFFCGDYLNLDDLVESFGLHGDCEILCICTEVCVMGHCMKSNVWPMSISCLAKESMTTLLEHFLISVNLYIDEYRKMCSMCHWLQMVSNGSAGSNTDWWICKVENLKRVQRDADSMVDVREKPMLRRRSGPRWRKRSPAGPETSELVRRLQLLFDEMEQEYDWPDAVSAIIAEEQLTAYDDRDWKAALEQSRIVH